MGKNREQKPSPEPPADTRLAELLAARGYESSPEPVATGALNLAGQGKLVVRRERKGRGGKTVTVVSGLALPAPRLEELARAMRKGLGCGSAVENGAIILQGDIAPRAQDWLAKHGATKIVLGN